MALQADWDTIQVKYRPQYSAKNPSKKRLPRFRLLFLASYAILEAQQAKWPGLPVRV